MLCLNSKQRNHTFTFVKTSGNFFNEIDQAVIVVVLPGQNPYWFGIIRRSLLVR